MLTVPELVQVAGFGAAALELAGPELAPRAYLARLTEAGHWPDAIRLLAHSLPRREGVWWAWVTARRVTPADAPPAVAAALEATERWISQPTDDHGYQAMQRAEAADFATPVGMAALAAFFSGTSVAPPGQPEVAPEPWMTAKMIAGAVLVASLAGAPETMNDRLRLAVTQGLDVVNKIHLWPE